MARKVIVGIAASAVICLAAAATAAAAPIRLALSQGAAFSILGHSCGGIQEQVYATGFAVDGYPAGDVYMQTRCGGSGRGGGYKVTTYSAWASTTWNWFGETRSYARLEGAAEGISTEFSEEDSHGNRIYNVGTAAYLDAPNPPLVPPAAPTAVTAYVSPLENGEEEAILRFAVNWEAAAQTAGLISSSTVTATPVGSSAPVLTATVSGSGTGAIVGPLQRHTTYQITVTNTDAEGTSQPSSPIELSSSGSEPPPSNVETCEQNQGTIKLSPGLEETPHVQSITIKGELKGCDGPLPVAEGRYTAHLTTTEEVTCSTLTSLSAEPTTTPVSLSVKWAPNEGAASSTGTLVAALSEAGAVALEGKLEGGPLETPRSIVGGSIWESFAGGPTCGAPPAGKAKAKVVKKGSFVGTAVELGE
jgi:hypothetical protein